MVDYKYKDIYNDTSVSKKMQIECSDGSVLNEEDWKGESAELTERLCSESEISFGRCEASTFKLRVRERVVPLAGKKISVSVTLEGADEAPFMMGVYKVDSDVPTADRRYRDIVAYDAMYDILNAEVSGWYNSLTFPMTLQQFRNSFCAYVGVEQEEITLVNDDMAIEKTMDPGELPGKTVIESICEINGCFGHISRNGKLRYVVLEQMIEGLYPAENLYPADDIYPADPMGTSEVSKSMYLSCQYEDFICQHIDKLQIRQEENDIGAISGTGNNCYIIEDNFLVYGKSAAELQTIADNVLSVIGVVWYRPAQVEARGNPCLEVGDGILLHTTREDVYTYILQRTLKGIQALRDSYTAEGEEYRTGQVNGLQKQIIQLKGKTNVLTRTVDETRLEMKDINQNLSTQIKAVAGEVDLKVSKDNLIAEINLTPDKALIKAERIDLVGVVNADELVSKYATIETLNVTKLELNNLIATKATIDSLNAVSGRVGSLEADHVTVSDLNGVSARLGTVEANYISAGTVKANYMEVANWTSSGVIKAERISAATIVNKLSSVDLISVRAIGVSGYMNYKGTAVAWRTKNISGTVITYLGPED
mgnify:FL=1|jgi:hypothetical protein|nr:MAG TPA: hypothetical protein [Caudoviricetes sp.]